MYKIGGEIFETFLYKKRRDTMSKAEELYTAIKNGHVDAVENYLSQPGINPNKTFDEGHESLLSAAVRRGSVAIVDVLVAKGAKINLAVQNKTPLHMACYDGDMRLVHALLGHGADTEVLDDTGRTPVHWAARQGHYTVYKHLSARGVALDSKAADGNTLLHDAAMGGDVDLIQTLLPASGNVSAKNQTGNAPIHLAALEGHAKAIQALLLKGAQIEDVNENKENILHIAAKGGHFRLVKFLLETLEIDPKLINAPTKDSSFTQLNRVKTATKNWTPLHFACAHGHMVIARYLLNHGADKSRRTKDGLRAVDVCKAYKQKQLLPLFVEEAEPESKIGDKREYMMKKVHSKK